MTMTEGWENVSKYYTKIASSYDDLYTFMYNYVADTAIKHLNLNPDDHLVDIGAGTGAVGCLIWEKVGLTNPVLCVEPSASMLEVAKTRNGVTTFLGTADAFLEEYSAKEKTCNKFFFSGSAHLLPKPVETFRKFHEHLQQDGMLVVMTRSAQSSFPMWSSLRQKFTPPSVDIEECLTAAGFSVSVTTETCTTTMLKREWYDKLRGRIFTTLAEFSDEEICKGIKELDQEWYPERKENDTVELKDSLVCYTATKN